jgi:hypothetical protein
MLTSLLISSLPVPRICIGQTRQTTCPAAQPTGDVHNLADGPERSVGMFQCAKYRAVMAAYQATEKLVLYPPGYV